MCPRATLLPNAKSKILEHQGYKWERIDNIINSGLHGYLQSGVIEAFETYKTHRVIVETLEQLRQV
jgi:hypothetical protein